MKDFNHAISYLHSFCHKNQIGFRSMPRITIVLRDERDKAYFLKGLREELQPDGFDSEQFAKMIEGDIRLQGFEIRILA